MSINVQFEVERVRTGSGARRRSAPPWRTGRPALLALSAAALLSPANDSRRGIPLSGPLAQGFAGDVFESRISPDATRIVFRADASTDGVVELYSVPSDGSSAPVELNAPIVSGGALQGFRVSPDSARVVFWGDVATNEVFELFSVPIDGSAAPQTLNQPLAPLGDVATSTFEPGLGISPDSSRVVYLADANTGVGDDWELFSAPIDGSAPPIRLNAPLVTGGDVGIFQFSGASVLFAPGFLIAPDGGRVLYLADQDTDGLRELFSVPIDASLAPVKLSGPMSPGGYVGYQSLTAGYRISPDSSRVAFIANLDGSGVNDLYGAPLDGSLPAVQLNSVLPSPSSRVEPDFQITPDSSDVVYRADQNAFFLFELFRAPLDASAPPTELSDLSGFPGIEPGIQISSTRAVYRVGAELFSVPIDASAAPQQISGPQALGSLSVPLRISADGSRVVYRSAQDSAQIELYSVPIDASAVPVQLNAALIRSGAVTEFALSPDGSRAVYRANQEIATMRELFSVPIDGSAAPVKLNGQLVPTGDVQSISATDTIPEFEISADGSLVTYLADQDIPDVTELYVVPTDASAAPGKLNGPLGTPFVAGDVVDFLVGPAEGRVLYRADQDTDEVFELYTAPLPAAPGLLPGAPLRLSGPSLNVMSDYALSPDESRVVYRASPDDIVFTADERQLYSVPSDGSAAPVLLNAPLATGGNVIVFLIAPDSSRVVYLADQERDESFELFSVPIDGSQAAVRISYPLFLFGRTPGGHQTSLPLDGDAGEFQISPDSRRVVYRGEVQRFVVELFSVPLDGSRRARRLNPPLGDEEDVHEFEISPDAQRVVFLLRDQGSLARLLSVPIDGSAGPVRLDDPTLLAGGCFKTLEITPDSTRVVFLAQESGASGNTTELYSAPIDGSQPHVKLNGPLPPGAAGVYDCGGSPPTFRISPAGDRVVYRADQAAAGQLQLYSAAVDGSAAAVPLGPPPVPGGDVLDFRFTPGGEQVLYRADQDADGLVELFRAPVDGSAPAAQLSDTLVPGGDVGLFVIGPDGLRTLYLAEQDADDVLELYCVPTGGGASLRVNPGLVASGDVSLPGNSSRPWFAFTPDGKRVIYSADQRVDQRFELFLSFLPPHQRRAP